jgi:hypothetical protein
MQISRLLAHVPCVGKHAAVVEAQEFVKLGLPIVQEDLLATHCLVFGEIQPHHDDAVELRDFNFAQIDLGNGHVRFAYLASLQGHQAHLWLAVIGAVGNQLGRSLSGDGEVKFVLDDAKELRGFGQVRFVVGCKRKDFPHPQVHAALARADVTHSLQQFAKVVRRCHSGCGRVLQPLVVHREAFEQVLAQPLRRPTPELRAAHRTHPVTYGQNRLEVVVRHPVCLAVDGSCQPVVDN